MCCFYNWSVYRNFLRLEFLFYYYLLFFFVTCVSSGFGLCVKKTPGVCSPIRVVSLRWMSACMSSLSWNKKTKQNKMPKDRSSHCVCQWHESLDSRNWLVLRFLQQVYISFFQSWVLAKVMRGMLVKIEIDFFPPRSVGRPQLVCRRCQNDIMTSRFGN
jgi:hypothetical protein